jgi:hypothetical protein
VTSRFLIYALVDPRSGQWGRKHTKETRLKMSRVHRGLTDEQRAEVVRLYGEGLSTRAVAAQVKTGAKVVWRILKMEGAVLRPQLRGFLNASRRRSKKVGL